jgi:hypothetical protein
MHEPSVTSASLNLDWRGRLVLSTPLQTGDKDLMNMRHFAKVAAGLLLCAAVPALAQSKPVVVVELYTSQGCSSCPPADEFMAELVRNPDVIALALHVDYWDYIGWKDIFAQAAFTDRQKAYATAIGSRTIYTPQMIINGAERVEGHNPDAVNMAVTNHLAVGGDIGLTVQRDGDVLTIGARPISSVTTRMDVQLVRFTAEQTVEITRGENAGRTIEYHNVVTDWQVLGQWASDTPLTMTATVSGDEPIVVIIQKAGNDAILAAARLD